MAPTTSQSAKILGPDPECFMTTPELILHNGYNAESYHLTTEDGYILNIFRITPSQARSPVVFLQHGLSSSSDDFLLNDRWGSFGFILAEAGFDVWLGNVRGNVYSMNHTTLSVKSQKFWDFSFQEMAEIDLPKMVDFVLDATQEQSLFYIGHSQGTEMGFIGFSQNQILARKIKLFIALAPIARISHVKGLLGLLAEFEPLIQPIYSIFGNRQFMSSTNTTRYFAVRICPIEALVEHLCEDIDSLTTGFDISNINQTRYPILAAHSDQSTSTKDIVHWAQLIKARKIQKFDYESPEKNMKHYNQTVPPSYHVENLDVPVMLVAGGRDWLGDPRDVLWLVETIRSQIVDVIFIDKYNHDDYINGMDAPELVFKPVMKTMMKFLDDDNRS